MFNKWRPFLPILTYLRLHYIPLTFTLSPSCPIYDPHLILFLKHQWVGALCLAKFAQKILLVFFIRPGTSFTISIPGSSSSVHP